jgi:hypothetical protein
MAFVQNIFAEQTQKEERENLNAAASRRRGRWRIRLIWWLAGLVLMLVVIRLLMPVAVKAKRGRLLAFQPASRLEGVNNLTGAGS